MYKFQQGSVHLFSFVVLKSRHTELFENKYTFIFFYLYLLWEVWKNELINAAVGKRNSRKQFN